MDPRVKFLTAGPMVIVAATLESLDGALLALGIGACLALIARLDMQKLLMRMAAINLFVLMIWATVPFCTPGALSAVIGPLEASREGTHLALMISLKTNAVALMSIAVFGTSEAMSLAHALVHLKIPRKLVYLFFFFYRYLSLLHEEYTRLRTAMRARCFTPSTSPHALRSMGSLIGMLLVRSHDRSERIYEAMLCRGFRGHFPLAHHFHLHTTDIIMACALISATAWMIA